MTLSYVRCECGHFSTNHSRGKWTGPARCYGITPAGKPCDCTGWREAQGEQY